MRNTKRMNGDRAYCSTRHNGWLYIVFMLDAVKTSNPNHRSRGLQHRPRTNWSITKSCTTWAWLWSQFFRCRFCNVFHSISNFYVVRNLFLHPKRFLYCAFRLYCLQISVSFNCEMTKQSTVNDSNAYDSLYTNKQHLFLNASSRTLLITTIFRPSSVERAEERKRNARTTVSYLRKLTANRNFRHCRKADFRNETVV